MGKIGEAGKESKLPDYLHFVLFCPEDCIGPTLGKAQTTASSWGWWRSAVPGLSSGAHREMGKHTPSFPGGARKCR